MEHLPSNRRAGKTACCVCWNPLHSEACLELVCSLYALLGNAYGPVTLSITSGGFRIGRCRSRLFRLGTETFSDMAAAVGMMQHDVPMHGLHVDTRGPDRPMLDAAGASHATVGNAMPLAADTPHPASRMSGASATHQTWSQVCSSSGPYRSQWLL